MTVATQVFKVIANGNDVATSFSFSPMVLPDNSTQITVVKTDIAGVETTLVEENTATGYAVVVSSFPGTGSITYPAVGGTPLATGESLTMKRVLTLEQTLDLFNQGRWNPETQELTFDRLVMIDLQQQEILDRSFSFPVSFDGVASAEIPIPDGGKILGWNTAGTALINFTPNSETFISGPGASVDNTIVRFNGVSGTDFQGSGVTIDDSDNVDVPGALTLGTELAVLEGGTGSGTASGARTNLGVPADTEVRKQGKETVWVPATAMRPTVTNGCAVLASVETTAGRPDLNVLDFDATSDEHAQFTIVFPKSWDEGTVTFQPVWLAGGAVTTGVAWGLQAVAVSDNETADVAFGTPVVTTDDAQGAVEEVLSAAESTAVTIAGTPAESDIVFFDVFRDVSDANDDMTQDARLLGIRLFFTTNAATDA